MVGMELPRETTANAVDAARRLFAGRDGRIALTLLLAVTAAIEANIYTPERPEFPFEDGGGDPAAAVILNVLAVLPLLAANRFPVIAAAATSFFSLVILASSETAVTLTALGVLLYTIGHLVAHRGPVREPDPFPVLRPRGHPVRRRWSGSGEHRPVPARRRSRPRRRVEPQAHGGGDRARRDAGGDGGERPRADGDGGAGRDRARAARHRRAPPVHDRRPERDGPAHVAEAVADARGRFEAIVATARDALTETRRLLGVLREDVEGDAERAPQPGLDQLGELVDTARDAGSNVRLILQGKVVALPAGIDLAGYRIVQEALTNARRHAPGADIDVEVSYEASIVKLRVRDHGPGPADDMMTGHGIVGMRDRATIAGGTFEFGAAEGGGFVVDVSLPTDGEAT